MRRFKALVDKGMTNAELAEWFCFDVPEVFKLRKALETQEKLLKMQKEKESNIALLQSSQFDIDTAKLDFEHVPPTTLYEISKAPEQHQLDLAVRSVHHKLTQKYIRTKVKELKGEPIEKPEVIDTGFKFTCPCCNRSYLLLHVNPSGEHRFQEVREA